VSSEQEAGSSEQVVFLKLLTAHLAARYVATVTGSLILVAPGNDSGHIAIFQKNTS
jgi:hypothetical protein